MAETTVANLDEMASLEGSTLGSSPWHTVTQDQIDRFADATGDHQWIHVDAERAADGPFGSTIAHGYLTLSLGPYFLPQILEVNGISMGVNYGCEKVRFPAPVKVDSRLRLTADLTRADRFDGGLTATIRFTFEVDGTDKPACVAEVVYRYFD